MARPSPREQRARDAWIDAMSRQMGDTRQKLTRRHCDRKLLWEMEGPAVMAAVEHADDEEMLGAYLAAQGLRSEGDLEPRVTRSRANIEPLRIAREAANHA